MTQQWKDSPILSIFRKGDKIDCSNYRGISPTTYKKFYAVFLPDVDKVTGDH